MLKIWGQFTQNDILSNKEDILRDLSRVFSIILKLMTFNMYISMFFKIFVFHRRNTFVMT